MHKIKWVLFTFSLVLLVGCQAKPTPTAPPPTAQVLRINVTPATTWIIPEMDACQKETVGLNLTVHEVYARQLISSEADLLILSGQPDLVNSYSVEIGKTQLIFIVNPANSIQDIPVEILKQIFGGGISQWSEVDPSLPVEKIQVWVPLVDDEIWTLLDASLLKSQSVSRLANIAPNPNAMLSAISSDKNAIGILPQPYLSQAVKALDNQPEIPLPVIAVTQSEPAGLIREFLLCLQASQLP